MRNTFHSNLSPRTFLAGDSLFRQYQDAFVSTVGASIHGRVVELGGERRYHHERFFPNAQEFCLTNVARDHDEFVDATAIPYPNRSQDAYLCVSVLEHVADPDKVLAEMRRTLRPDGIAIITTPFLYPIHDEIDYWRPSPEWFNRSGFDIDQLMHLGGRLSAVANLLQRPPGRWRRKDIPRKLIGLAVSSLGRFDERDDSPIGIGVVIRSR